MVGGSQMKIGIITFHRADNYGAVLQAYALQETLRNLGNDVEIIDYRCDAIENDYIYQVIPAFNSNIFLWTINFINRFYVVHKKRIKGKKCKKFRKDYLILSPSVKTRKDREIIQKEYDLIITGSDQIWSIKLTSGKDDWYCYKQENMTGAQIVSYGASVGNLELFKHNFELFRNDLKMYKKISVREDETKEYLEKELSRCVQRVVDPTILLEKKYWDDIVKDEKSVINDDYVLYYDVEGNEIAKRIALSIAKKNKLKLAHFDTSLKLILTEHFVQEAGPLEFLSLIKNAKYVVTSSFHATVFSVIFEKSFVTIPHPKTGARVRCLLLDLGLGERIVSQFDDSSVDVIKQDIDYNKVGRTINKMRTQSLIYISECIDSGRKK